MMVKRLPPLGVEAFLGVLQGSAWNGLTHGRDTLAIRADLLNSKSLDPDLAEERIRAVLGYSREGDVVIPRREIDALLQDAPAP